MKDELLYRLSEPFPPEDVAWKPGTAKDTKCMAMAFADLRTYMERLDEVCGLDWSVEYLPWGDGRIIARLTIANVTRCSTGEADAQDAKNGMAGTVAEAQAMKRAAAMFGLGRYLYDLPSAWVDYDPAAKRISKAGLAELDNRYRTWFAKTMAARKNKPQRSVDTVTGEILPAEPQSAPASEKTSPGDVLFDTTPATPTLDELATIKQWRNRTEAEMWAVMSGACENEHESRNSMEKSIARYGGKVDKDTYVKIYIDFYRRQQTKPNYKALQTA